MDKESHMGMVCPWRQVPTLTLFGLHVSGDRILSLKGGNQSSMVRGDCCTLGSAI